MGRRIRIQKGLDERDDGVDTLKVVLTVARNMRDMATPDRRLVIRARRFEPHADDKGVNMSLDLCHSIGPSTGSAEFGELVIAPLQTTLAGWRNVRRLSGVY